ncbi:MAG TPA: hypothetical protein PLA85_11690 [Micropepsaceae bacterium]|nr:hypothetical protein [Micropepsaceae bacterium]
MTLKEGTQSLRRAAIDAVRKKLAERAASARISLLRQMHERASESDAGRIGDVRTNVEQFK